ncbi:MAG TPA: penicillin-binding protein 1C, partial [Rhodanobacter sp.]
GWSLDGALPPTFAERDLGAWTSGLLSLRLDSKGRRLSGSCHGNGEHTIEIARWPALATSWLGLDDRAHAALPPLAPGCPADSLDSASPIRIAGISNGITLRRAPNSDQPLRVRLQALGAQGTVQWLLDGRLQGTSENDAAQTLSLIQPGAHSVTALTRNGAFSSLQLSVTN